MDEMILDRIQIAESLALQARVATLAGDRKRARELRAQLDSLWDALEAQAAGAIPANNLDYHPRKQAAGQGMEAI